MIGKEFVNKKILLLGYFGYISNQLDGQTIKTRDVEKILTDRCVDGDIKRFDTERLKSNKLLYLQLFFFLIWCDHLVYLPGKNNLTKTSPLINFLIKYKKLNVYYLVVGGWLSEFLEDKNSLVDLLRRFKFIGVESNILAEKLSVKYGFKNVGFFPNFRIHNFIPITVAPSKTLRLVFMARIMKEKGLPALFDLAKYVDENKLDISITFYGPVQDKDYEYFYTNLSRYHCVEYRGVLEPADIYSTLCGYDALVLATEFATEGFPGSILDAYISSVPVLVTKWDYAIEFVEDTKTGYVVNNTSELIKKAEFLLNNTKALEDMKLNARIKSQEYSAEKAWDVLKAVLKEDGRD